MLPIWVRPLTALVRSTALWLALGAIPALAATWNGHETVEQKHVWRRSDTLAGLLFKQGLGKQKGPLQLYGNHGWVRANSERNHIKDWAHIASGTEVVLVLPKSLATPKTEASRAANLHAATTATPRPRVHADRQKQIVSEVGPEDEADREPDLVQERAKPQPLVRQAAAVNHHAYGSPLAHPATIPVAISILLVAVGSIMLLRVQGQAKMHEHIKQEMIDLITTEDHSGAATLMESSAIEPRRWNTGRFVRVSSLSALRAKPGEKAPKASG